jgi:hypothetical protein
MAEEHYFVTNRKCLVAGADGDQANGGLGSCLEGGLGCIADVGAGG